jgi:two-component system cell cycle response regulator
LVLMPHTAMDVAYPVAERIRQFVQQWPFKIGDGEAMISVTISIGLAAFPSPGIEGKTELLKAADEAMYEAKHAGKNRTVLYKTKRA